MSYGVSLESMLIPEASSNGYPEELAALENWIIDMESQLIAEDITYLAAMEAEGAEAGGVSPSSFVTRIREAFNKLRSGKKNGDEAAVSAAAEEIKTASDEFTEESNKEEDPDKKKKWKKAAAIIAAIVAAVGIAIGATALARNAKNKASSGEVTPDDAKTMANQALALAQKADPKAIAAPEDRKALPAPKKEPINQYNNDNKRYSDAQVSADKASRGTGASKVNPDGTTTKLLSREEKRDANRTAQYSGNRASKRHPATAQENPAQKKARLLREAAERTAASGGTVSKEQDRRVKNAEKKANIQATANAHNIIAQANALRGEQKASGTAPAAAPTENKGEIQELLNQVNSHFANMKKSGGLQVKTSGSGSTFYKRTKQGDQAKVYKKEIDGMAQAIARLTQLGYNGDAINMYNQLKKAQK